MNDKGVYGAAPAGFAGCAKKLVGGIKKDCFLIAQMNLKYSFSKND